MSISDTTLQAVKEVSLIDVISQYVELKRHGSEYRAICPFHEERTPSFYVNPHKGYKCFGCDAAGGDAIAFIMAVERKSFPDAVIHVAAMSGIQIEHKEGVLPIRKPIDRKRTFVSKPISFIPLDVFQDSLNDFDQNKFVKFLLKLFGPDTTNELIETYYIGSHSYWPGSTVFWQIDISGQIRTGKIMLYHPVTGKRVKEPYDHFSFIHKGLNQPEFELKQCFFGEHLLKNNSKPVAIVESEKTAIIASAYFPDLIWLASGGLSNLNIEKCRSLRGRNIILYPDLNGFEDWTKKANELRNEIPGLQIKVSDLLNKEASESEKMEKLDLADYLIKLDYSKYRNPFNREYERIQDALIECEKWLFVNPDGGIFEFDNKKYSFEKR